MTAASADYLRARSVPVHPRDLLEHVCLRHRFSSGSTPPWEFERDGDIIKVDHTGPLTVSTAGADLEIGAALRGLGIIYLFEDWLSPYIQSGDLVIVLDDWCKPFDGPKLYFSKRAVIHRPLRLFLDHVQDHRKRS